MTKIRYFLPEIDAVAKSVLHDIDGAAIITLTGGLGAGKTTFTRAMVAAMGATESVTSPTFTYFNVYHVPQGVTSSYGVFSHAGGQKMPVRTIYHFDLYRLKNAQEFESAGFFEYLYQPETVALIEWPAILDGVIQAGVCSLDFQVNSAEERLLTYQCTR